MRKLFRELALMWSVFEPVQRWQMAGLVVLTVLGAFLEMVGVSAVLPFVQVVTSPDMLETNALLSWLYRLAGEPSRNFFLVFLLGILILAYLVKNAFLLFLYDLQYRFSYGTQRIIEGKLLSCYMHQKYSFHLEKNSAELQRNIIQDVVSFFYSLQSYLQLFTEGCVVLALFGLMFYLDKSILLGMASAMVCFVLIYFGLLRKKLQRIGEESRAASAKRVQWVQQSLGGIKEIKILEREPYFLKSYDANSKIYADRQRKSQMTSLAPRPIMEALGVASLLTVVGVKILRGVVPTYFMATLSGFAVSAFRLLPSFGRISGSLGTILFQHPAVMQVCADLKEAKALDAQRKTEQGTGLSFSSRIQVEHLRFIYPNTDKPVLDEVNLTIRKNQSVALVGPSGAGKTTLADILLGVLEPTAGKVTVDGEDLFAHLSAWHAKVGYIPQNIYLMDDTIRHNVAFGIPEGEIDNARVREALREAQLYDFTLGLEKGMETQIGEGGVRLSGGQRQRIGIARALYSDPEVLVLDEATSALDSDTEKAIMEAIQHLQGSKTLLIIAHRLTTIKDCDVIYEVRDGGVRQRRYEELS